MALIGSDKRNRFGFLCRVCLPLLLGMLIAVPVAGCGGAPPKPAEATTETAQLVLLVTGEGRLAASLQARLAQAGYRIVSDKNGTYDAVVEVSENNVQNKSIITIKVNNQQSVSYTTHATVTLKADGVTLATATAEYDSEEGIDADDLERIVATITNKPTMTKLARDIRQRKDQVSAAAKKEADEKEAKERAEKVAAEKKAAKEDEAAWAQVIVAECTNPRDESGCDKVKEYLAKLPDGIHALEARAAVEKGTAAIAAMLDERAWNGANLGACRDPKESTDCDGVKKYMNDFPSGAHVAEAREAIDATRGKLEKLAAKEDKEAERESKRLEAEEKKTEREQCKKQCRSECQFARIGYFDTCVNRCVQANCD